MKSVLQRSLFIFVLLMLISSTSFANLKKGKVATGATRQFEYIPPTDGVNLFSLIFDNVSTDLDFAIGLDGDLVGSSISPDSFFETLQLGLIGNRRYTLVIDSFEGPGTAFRLVANSAQQEVISSAVDQNGLREVELTRDGMKLRDSLRKISKIKK
jgi:hypothetical protein